MITRVQQSHHLCHLKQCATVMLETAVLFAKQMAIRKSKIPPGANCGNGSELTFLIKIISCCSRFIRELPGEVYGYH